MSGFNRAYKAESTLENARPQQVLRMPWAVTKNGKLLGVWATHEAATRFATLVGGEVVPRAELKSSRK